ncbi:DUF6624 domain-containing protein [Mucilaginibacter sp. UR6-11]|uniref:DUF6624 domain-containing protein n=1 Tax=Mucilaginibacter sp. UR6-11 TaxID=1435644 RepID=UPI001E39FDEE|nr:DUF6624 domain-containing protein [Mucilaginibacter sp. UR6-11]MCC8425326.1 hypothetical protein [Mucilaginibacter sp. UR6-11]
MKTLSLLFLTIISSFVSTAQVISFNIDKANLDNALAAQLDSIYKLDQLVRMDYIRARELNLATPVTDSLLRVLRKTDRENLIAVNYIVKKHGWLSPQKVGFNGAQGLFLVIQHADLKTQQRYLPIIKEAEKKGEILSSNLAILEDRINMREGKKQAYGSQGFTDSETGKKYIYPIVDVDNLDKRRKAMGMPPMQEYVKDWNTESYKKQLPEIERLAKKKNLILAH